MAVNVKKKKQKKKEHITDEKIGVFVKVETLHMQE